MTSLPDLLYLALFATGDIGKLGSKRKRTQRGGLRAIRRIEE
jgi:hypothetical protein